MFSETRDANAVLRLFGLLAIGGVLLIVTTVWRAGVNPASVSAAASLTLVAGAAGFVGASTGFLFAVPRSRQVDLQQPVPSDGFLRLNDYSANTNLEQVSDWLTKIIIGVSLVEARRGVALLGATAQWLADKVGGGAVSATVTAAGIVYFSALGFLCSYLATRLWMPKALSRAEREEAKQILKETIASGTEAAVVAALYRDPPSGYEDALSLISAYERESRQPLTRNLAVYKACGLGQKHADLKDTDPGAADETKREAVKAVRKALEMYPSERSRLAAFYEASGEDNDLSSLQPDLDRLLSDR